MTIFVDRSTTLLYKIAEGNKGGSKLMHSLELPSCSDVIISQWYTLLNFPVVPNIQYF